MSIWKLNYEHCCSNVNLVHISFVYYKTPNWSVYLKTYECKSSAGRGMTTDTQSFVNYNSFFIVQILQLWIVFYTFSSMILFDTCLRFRTINWLSPRQTQNSVEPQKAWCSICRNPCASCIVIWRFHVKVRSTAPAFDHGTSSSTKRAVRGPFMIGQELYACWTVPTLALIPDL